MTDETQGGLEPSSQPSTTPESVPAQTAVNAEPESFAIPEKFAGKSADEIARAYVEAEKRLGQVSNELGELRSVNQQYEQWYQSEYVADPDDPNTPIHRSVLEARQNSPRQPVNDGQLTQEDIDEQLRILMDEKPSEYHRIMVEAAKNELRQEQNQFQQAFTSPAAQQVLSESPDIRPRAEQIALERGIPVEDALKQAVGEKILGGIQGAAQPNAGLPQPNTPAISRLITQNRTFVQAGGTIPEQQPESRLTEAQVAMARKLGYDPSELEPYAD